MTDISTLVSEPVPEGEWFDGDHTRRLVRLTRYFTPLEAAAFRRRLDYIGACQRRDGRFISTVSKLPHAPRS